MGENAFLVKKGLWLGFILVAMHKIFCTFFYPQSINHAGYYLMVAIAFGFMVSLFIMAQSVRQLLITGFTGLFVLICTEILLSVFGEIFVLFDFGEIWFETYIFGFFGSIGGVILAFVLLFKKVRLDFLPKQREILIPLPLKMKMLLYLFVSAIGFAYLVLPENAGVSVAVFAAMQFICLWLVMQNRKRLWLFIPIFIFSLQALISANSIFRMPNVLLSLIIYSIIFMDFELKNTSLRFFKNMVRAVLEPIGHFKVPFQWALDANKKKAPVIKRILVSLAITIPSLILLITILSFADMVFSNGVNQFFSDIYRYINVNVLLKTLYGILVGLYLFGRVYAACDPQKQEKSIGTMRQGDLIIFNILLVSILAIYTIFVAIQFKYLFAVSSLPYGLSYTEYARKGFFELFSLTGVNIVVILMTVHFTKEIKSLWSTITKYLCFYLCCVTFVLLVSSFYRMWLYQADDGLTRLRFMVFGFLIFEGLGLFLTLIYILRPTFNMVAVYVSIGLLYYVLLNIIPMDYYVAKSQVDRYFRGDHAGIAYTMSLSEDAAPQIARLVQMPPSDIQNDPQTQSMAMQYFENQIKYSESLPSRWQRYNLSEQHMKQLFTAIKSQ